MMTLSEILIEDGKKVNLIMATGECDLKCSICKIIHLCHVMPDADKSEIARLFLGK